MKLMERRQKGRFSKHENRRPAERHGGRIPAERKLMHKIFALYEIIGD